MVVPPPRTAIINVCRLCATKSRPRNLIALYFHFDFDTMLARSLAAKRASKRGESMPHVVTKSELVEVAAKASNVSKAAAGEAVSAAFAAGQGFKQAVDKN